MYKRQLITFVVIIIIWYVICLSFELPPFILPSPNLVAIALFNNFSEILNHSSITLLEILLSLFFGVILGGLFAVLISLSEKLKRFNIIMGFLHLVQGSTLFWLGTVVNTDFVVPITLTQLGAEGNPGDPSSFALVPQLEIWREISNFGPAVATFLLASAVAHFLISGPFYSQYQEDLQKGMNKVRWVEYSISA